MYAVKVSELDKTRGVTSITSFKYPPFLIEPPRFVDETHRAVVRADSLLFCKVKNYKSSTLSPKTCTLHPWL